MGNRLTVSLTGERVLEFETCRDILESIGVTSINLTPQRVLSAALQVMIAHKQHGGEIIFHFDDARRTPED